jgi:hypothetical protein
VGDSRISVAPIKLTRFFLAILVAMVLLDGVRKRIACVALALLLVAPTLTSEAQQPLKIARIGYLSPLSAAADSPHREALREGLRTLGSPARRSAC